jgi:hypothetical protein
MDTCGICGHEESGEGGLCASCKGDTWVEKEDFLNPDLEDHIKVACMNLNMTRSQLQSKVCKERTKKVSRWAKSYNFLKRSLNIDISLTTH